MENDLLRDVARQATEVGRHAANEALQALVRVIGALPNDAYRATAMGIALGVVQHKIDGFLNMGDGPADILLKAMYARTYDGLQKDPEAAKLLSLLRDGKLDEAARLIGVDPATLRD